MTMGKLAAAIRMAGMAVAFFIAIGIALVALDAKEEGLVNFWIDTSRSITEPFHGLVDLEKGREHLQIGINWGIAAAVYLGIALLVSRLLVGMRLRRRRAAAA